MDNIDTLGRSDRPGHPIIRCEHVTLGYGRDVVLKGVSLNIPGGILLPFVGPNGAGKTTLLRAILGLIKPLNGRIHTPFAQAPAGYVPQLKSIDPLFPLTVREIVAMGFYPKLRWWGRQSPEDRRELDAALEELALTEHAHKNYRDLSGGTKQKTLIARALVSGAEVFILDEPTSELDHISEQVVVDHLWRLVHEKHKTVLLAHHGLQDIHLKASQVCLVNHGVVSIVDASQVRPTQLRSSR